MQFTVRYFPEITLKSRPVRKQMARQLQTNLHRRLQPVDPGVRVAAGWDRLTVYTSGDDGAAIRRVVGVLQTTPGIAHALEVVEYPLADLPDLVDKVVALWAPQLAGKRFAVRCRRQGEHGFSSREVECTVGAALLGSCESAAVDLSRPDEWVRIEVVRGRFYVGHRRYQGLGGYPCGTIGSVLSLMSGGFDSTVASYQMMRRGTVTHFLFFNLGGHAHELGVKEVSLFLWMKYGGTHPVQFISVPFDEVVAELQRRVDDSYMGVLLKRLMLRAAGAVAAGLEVEALVTGESIAQVSSQTLRNLAAIDEVSDRLVLRPLIAAHKSDIVAVSREIGAEAFAAAMPEYCGAISVKPTTRARPERIRREEARFDCAVLERAVAAATWTPIDALSPAGDDLPAVAVVSCPTAGSVIIDVRHPEEREQAPLVLPGWRVLHIPFFELHGRFAGLEPDRRYLLYCGQGVMSRLHAAHLLSQGFANVGVYRPE